MSVKLKIKYWRKKERGDMEGAKTNNPTSLFSLTDIDMRQSAVAAGLKHVCILQSQQLTSLGDNILFRRIRHVGHVDYGDGLVMEGRREGGEGGENERL